MLFLMVGDEVSAVISGESVGEALGESEMTTGDLTGEVDRTAIFLVRVRYKLKCVYGLAIDDVPFIFFPYFIPT